MSAAARESKVGMSPGTLIHIGRPSSDPVHVVGMRFRPQGEIEVREHLRPEDASDFASADDVAWVDVRGVHDVQAVQRIGQDFALHPLLLEDLVNTNQRPKSEDYGNQFFLVLKMILHDEDDGDIQVEQVSIVFGPSWVLTFQEHEGDTFDPVRRRLLTPESRVRANGADFLAYALMDTVVDNYLAVVEELGERVEELEPDVINRPDDGTLEEIYAIKRALVTLRRFVGPAKDAIAQLRRAETPLVQQPTRLYLRDVEDHLTRVSETIDLYREMVQGMVDAYLSSLSNRMNDVMRVLTVIATIFIPLTFIVGVYGMNFDDMPELHWSWAYPAIWVFMVGLGGGLLVLFRRRGWL